MKKCPYCESELILINEFNTEDIYGKYGYECTGIVKMMIAKHG